MLTTRLELDVSARLAPESTGGRATRIHARVFAEPSALPRGRAPDGAEMQPEADVALGVVRREQQVLGPERLRGTLHHHGLALRRVAGRELPSANGAHRAPRPAITAARSFSAHRGPRRWTNHLSDFT